MHRWVDGRPATVGRPVAPVITRWAGAMLAVRHPARVESALGVESALTV